MRRVVMGSEVGVSHSLGWGAVQTMRRTTPRFRISEPYRIAGWSLMALIAVAAIGHLH